MVVSSKLLEKMDLAVLRGSSLSAEQIVEQVLSLKLSQPSLLLNVFDGCDVGELSDALRNFSDDDVRALERAGCFRGYPVVVARLLLDGVLPWELANQCYERFYSSDSRNVFCSTILDGIPASVLVRGPQSLQAPFWRELLGQMPAEFILSAYSDDSGKYEEVVKLTGKMRGVLDGEGQLGWDEFTHAVSQFPLLAVSGMFTGDEWVRLLLHVFESTAVDTILDWVRDAKNIYLAVPCRAACYRFFSNRQDILEVKKKVQAVGWPSPSAESVMYMRYSFNALADACAFTSQWIDKSPHLDLAPVTQRNYFTLTGEQAARVCAEDTAPLSTYLFFRNWCKMDADAVLCFANKIGYSTTFAQRISTEHFCYLTERWGEVEFPVCFENVNLRGRFASLAVRNLLQPCSGEHAEVASCIVRRVYCEGQKGEDAIAQYIAENGKLADHMNDFFQHVWYSESSNTLTYLLERVHKMGAMPQLVKALSVMGRRGPVSYRVWENAFSEEFGYGFMYILHDFVMEVCKYTHATYKADPKSADDSLLRELSFRRDEACYPADILFSLVVGSALDVAAVLQHPGIRAGDALILADEYSSKETQAWVSSQFSNQPVLYHTFKSLLPTWEGSLSDLMELVKSVC